MNQKFLSTNDMLLKLSHDFLKIVLVYQIIFLQKFKIKLITVYLFYFVLNNNCP